MAGVQKPVINAIRSVAFLLAEMEETQINETVRDAFDSQITEFTSDMKLLVDDTKEKLDAQIKTIEDRIRHLTIPAMPPDQPRQPTNTYASVLINPPAHANPRVAAREGIKARQFAFEGIKNSKFSHLDSMQLKVELNKILLDLGLSTGKIHSVTNARNGSTIVEADNDEAASWFSRPTNQRRLCDRIGSNAEFRSRSFNIIAFNVVLSINPDDENHRAEICKANGLEPTTITAAKWAKAVERRSPTQRTAHLLITLNDADAANRAITNGLNICNRRCHVEKTKREPTRCLKCQGWNHYAKDCIEEGDRCGNCAGAHRTNLCLTGEKRCVSCRVDDYASWSRTCPVFLKKMDEFNTRNPDNSLQFFPTADPWTWIPTTNHQPQTQLKPQLQTQSQQPRSARTKPTGPTRPNGSQPSSKAQQKRRQYDTYIPGDVYIPDYNQAPNTETSAQPTGWEEEPAAGSSNAQSSKPPTQQREAHSWGDSNATTTTTNISISNAHSLLSDRSSTSPPPNNA